MNDSDVRGNFRDIWDVFRKKRFLFFFLWFAFFPITIIVIALLRLILPETEANAITIIYIGVYSAFWLKAMFSYTSFRCPRCGERFLKKQGSIWGLRLGATRCMNCGVRVHRKT